MIHTATAYARAGLAGNPSDGYFGKTVSFAIRDFKTTVRLWDSPHFEIVPDRADRGHYDSVAAFLQDAHLMGYYGAMRLLKATVKRFHDRCAQRGKDLSHKGNFSLDMETNIPRLVGLSGSSSIVVATLRALCKFYEIEIPREELPTLALSVETKELNIAAGLQDRVIQTYEGIVHMDFERELVERTGAGRYTPMKPTTNPQVYVAYDPQRAEVSDIAHRNLRQAWEDGEKDVHEAMGRLAALADEAREAITEFNMARLHKVTNENFDIRKSIMPIAPENQNMIDVARSTGASAKFAGSGGAICGVYLESVQYERLVAALAEIGCTVLRPTIFEDQA